MKLFMILVDGDHARDVERLLESCDVPGYSQIPTVLGKGRTGRKLGTREFPGSSTMYMVAAPAECAGRLTTELSALRDAAGREEGLKAYALDTTELL